MRINALISAVGKMAGAELLRPVMVPVGFVGLLGNKRAQDTFDTYWNELIVGASEDLTTAITGEDCDGVLDCLKVERIEP